VEQAVEKSGGTLEEATLEEMEALWQEAKTAT
ncbi:nucleoside triphosphate pyrophosphohydrolase, partial [Mesorhizobium sp. M2D.F.Ca.ET.145.01.1.1]